MSPYTVRIYALLWLIPLAIIWWWLCVNVPYEWRHATQVSRIDDDSFVTSVDSDSRKSYLVFDIHHRKWHVDHDRMNNFPKPPLGLSLLSRTNVTPSDSYNLNGELITQTEMRLFDHEQNRFVRTLELTGSAWFQSHLVAGRYILAQQPGGTEAVWLDLTAPKEDWHSIKLAWSPSIRVMSHPTQPVFVYAYANPSKPTSTSAPQFTCELYRFDEHGQLKQMNTWPVPSTSGVILDGDLVANLNPSGTQIEFRSFELGQLVKTTTLSERIDLSKITAELSAGFLAVRSADKSWYVSTEDGRTMISPFETTDNRRSTVIELTPDRQRALWWHWETGEAVIADARSDQVIARLPDRAQFFRVMNDSTLISVHCLLGVTDRKYDLLTGEQVYTWRPFWWVLPAGVLAVLASGAWIWHWIRLDRRSALWAWFDLGTLFLLMMTLSVGRLVATGDPDNATRVPYELTISLSAGFLALAWLWLVLSQQPITNRITILLAMVAITVGAFTWTIDHQTGFVWSRVGYVSLSGIVASLVASIAKQCGYKLTEDREGDQPARRKHQITVSQLLALTVASACLFIAARSQWPGLPELLNQPRSSLPLATVAGLIGVLGLYLALSPHACLVQASTIACIVLTILLTLDALMYDDILHNLPSPEWLQTIRPPIQHCGVVLVVVFFSAIVSPLPTKSGEVGDKRLAKSPEGGNA